MGGVHDLVTHLRAKKYCFSDVDILQHLNASVDVLGRFGVLAVSIDDRPTINTKTSND